MIRGRIALPAVLAAALALAGCGETPPPDPAVQELPGSNGLETYVVASGGFSVAVPESWTTASADEVFTEENVSRMTEEAPALAPALASLGTPRSPIKLLAYDGADVDTEFATNLNVIVEPLPRRVARDRYFALTLEQLRRFLGPETPIREERVKLPAGWAMKLDYQGLTGPPGAVATRQYIFFRREAGYVLTYTTLPDRLLDDEPDFARSARTFRLL